MKYRDCGRSFHRLSLPPAGCFQHIQPEHFSHIHKIGLTVRLLHDITDSTGHPRGVLDERKDDITDETEI